jgi:hypothetical protein
LHSSHSEDLSLFAQANRFLCEKPKSFYTRTLQLSMPWQDEQGQAVPEVEGCFFWQGFHAIMWDVAEKRGYPSGEGGH